MENTRFKGRNDENQAFVCITRHWPKIGFKCASHLECAVQAESSRSVNVSRSDAVTGSSPVVTGSNSVLQTVDDEGSTGYYTSVSVDSAGRPISATATTRTMSSGMPDGMARSGRSRRWKPGVSVGTSRWRWTATTTLTLPTMTQKGMTCGTPDGGHNLT